MKEMKGNKYHYRSKMVHILMEKEVLPANTRKITTLFKDLDESKKEALAKQICAIIETSQTEEEMVDRAKEILCR